MKGTLRFLSLLTRWTTLLLCCAFALSGLSHFSAFSQYRRDTARQISYESIIHPSRVLKKAKSPQRHRVTEKGEGSEPIRNANRFLPSLFLSFSVSQCLCGYA